MAGPLWFDRVRETSSTSGTGAITPSGAYNASFQTIGAVMAASDTAYFTVVDGSGNWNTFLGTWNGTSVERTTILAGSSGGSAVNLSGSGVELWIDAPASYIENTLTKTTTFFAGVPLTGVTFKNISNYATVSGANDFYTCPSGKKAILLTPFMYTNDTAGTITLYMTFKKAGVYYRIGANASAPTINVVLPSVSGAPILTAGEIFSLNDSAGGGGFTVGILEFDATVPLNTAIITSVAASNTLYTVPVGKTARLISVVGEPLYSSIASFAHVNHSGGAVTRQVHYVPSGSSATASNRLITGSGTSTANDAIGTSAVVTLMNAGDSIIVTLSGTGANQLLFLNYTER